MIRVLLSVLLLWASAGWADEPLTIDTNSYFSAEPSSIRVDRQSFEAMLKDYPDAKLRVMLVDESCERKMQAAMRAMENYLPVRFRGNIIISDSTPWQEYYQSKEYRRDWDQWDAVKKECWRQE